MPQHPLGIQAKDPLASPWNRLKALITPNIRRECYPTHE
jgi:hypothetical protein